MTTLENSPRSIESRQTNWHSLSAPEAESRLLTSTHGLSNQEASARIGRYGPNQVEAVGGPSQLAMLLNQIRSPLVLVLIVAGVVTALLGEYADSVVIIAVVILNTIVGFVQERQAERSIRSLLLLVGPRAHVIRERKDMEIDSRELVPGDVVLLESGARVPADLRLMVTTSLQIDESTLTGESVPVVKHIDPLPIAAGFGERSNLAYAGTTVTSGRGRGYVFATGRLTQIGEIALAVGEVGKTATPLQLRLDRLARNVGVAVAVCAVLAFLIGIATGRSASEMFLIAVALAVSAVPEGLPIAVTITLAVGVRRMARRRAIVRRLPSVETLGSTTVIGSDKTGTLTENLMTVRQIWTSDGPATLPRNWDGYSADGAEQYGPEGLLEGSPRQLTLLTGVLTNEAVVSRDEDGFTIQGDPTEAALLIAATRFGLDPDADREAYRMIAEVPFEPERQFSASVRQRDDRRLLLVKGAPERVMAMCVSVLTAGGPEPLDHESIQAAAHDLASEGQRVLAMAYKEIAAGAHDLENIDEPKGLTLLGLQGMSDPPREGAREAIATCQTAGIRVVMVTGDHIATARAISRELGIGGEHPTVLTGSEVEAINDEEMRSLIGTIDIYARVAPLHKLRIVRALQADGNVVAVTGDGVNDAPALKAADIGIAMGKRGTDVAKEASDMVLTDDNFVSIAAAVEEGRITFDNIRKVLYFLFGTNGAEVLTILIALALDWPLPLIAAQILWLNLATDSLQVMALAFEPGEPDVMARHPRPKEAGILSRLLWERVGLATIVMTAGTLVLFRTELTRTGSVQTAQTAALTTMVLFQMFQAMNARSESRSVFRLNPLGNPLLFIAIFVSIGMHAAALYLSPTQYLLRVEPLDIEAWGRALLAASTIVLVTEAHKLLRRR